jgi:hypothetical protein
MDADMTGWMKKSTEAAVWRHRGGRPGFITSGEKEKMNSYPEGD